MTKTPKNKNMSWEERREYLEKNFRKFNDMSLEERLTYMTKMRDKLAQLLDDWSLRFSPDEEAEEGVEGVVQDLRAEAELLQEQAKQLRTKADEIEKLSLQTSFRKLQDEIDEVLGPVDWVEGYDPVHPVHG